MTGIPSSKIDILRPLFERYAKRLTSSSHINNLIPSVLEKQSEKQKAEVYNVKEASIVFEETVRLGEALAIVLIWADRPTRLRCKESSELLLTQEIFAIIFALNDQQTRINLLF